MNENETLENITTDLKIVFDKPVSFEGEEYKEIDLSDLASKLKANVLLRAQRVAARSCPEALTQESTLAYCLSLASSATGLPIEFFENLPVRDAIKVRATVSSFLFN